MYNGGWVNTEVDAPEKNEEHFYTDQAIKDVIGTFNCKLDKIMYKLQNLEEKMTQLKFNADVNNVDLEVDEKEAEKARIKKSNQLMGWFVLLGESGFPIDPYKDDITCIPANALIYQFKDKEIKSIAATTAYTEIHPIKAVMHDKGMLFGSIDYWSDESKWFNLDDIRNMFRENIKPATEYVYMVPAEEDNYPRYIETYEHCIEDSMFVYNGKEDMQGLKYITILNTCISVTDDDRDTPVAFVKIRCRDDELFTGKWIKFNDLVRMD